MMSLLFAPCIVVCDPLKQFSKEHICRFGVGLDGEVQAAAVFQSGM